MPLTLDATIGGTSANSYATIAQGDTYHLGSLNRSTWLTATDTQKSTGLVMATRLLDEQILWYGAKAVSSQALRHPRSGLYDADGDAVSTSALAPKLIDATCELAFWLLTSDRVADQDNAGLSELTLGDIELVFKDQSKTQVIPDSVLTMLSDIGEPLVGSPVVKLVRS